MTKITLADLANLENQTTAVNLINSNNSVIETGFDNTLSRNGASPNQMGATLDMNSHRIINLPAPFSRGEPFRLGDYRDYVEGTGVVFPQQWGYVFLGDPLGVEDVTVELQDAVDEHQIVLLREGTYKLSSVITLNDNQTIIMSSGTVLAQITPHTGIFTAVNKSFISLICNSARLFGEGTYHGNIDDPYFTPGFTNGKCIEFFGCDNYYISRPHIKNFSASGIFIWGGSANSLIDGPVVEGTNLYTTPVLVQANYQDAISLADDPTYGAIDGLTIVSPNVSGTAQGITIGNLGVSTTNRELKIVGLNAHDIPGQHGMYTSSSNWTVEGATLTNLALSGIKCQISQPGLDSYNITATNIIADTLGGNMFEFGVLGSGVNLRNVRLSGVGRNVNRGLSIGGPVKGLVADILIEDSTGEGLVLQGNGAENLDIRFDGTRLAFDGMLITGENHKNIRIYPIIKEANVSNTGRFGLYFSSATSKIELFNPSITDVNNRMVNAIYNVTSGGEIAVYGSASLTGASGYAVRTTGHITSWPNSVIIQGASGTYQAPINIDRTALGSTEVPYTSLHFGGSTSGTGNLKAPDVAGTSEYTLPAATDTLVGRTSVDTLTNKTINGNVNTITNVSVSGAAGGSLGGTYPNPTVVTNANLTGVITSVGNATSIASQTGTGTKFVVDTSPTLVTPNLGTPSAVILTNGTGLPIAGLTGLGTGVATGLGTNAGNSGSFVPLNGSGGTPTSIVLTNATGTAASLTAGNVTTNANLTGAVTSVGNATSLGSFTSANLATALTDETGTGANVFATSPTLVTPALGAATGTSLNLSGLTVSSAVATDGSKNLVSVTNTGTGSNVLATSPTLVTPILGTPTSGVATNLTGLPLTTGVTGTLPVANGGSGDTGTAWSTYTPTITSQTGTITTSSATGRYKQFGKTTYLEIDATVTTAGTGAGSLLATLPVTAAANNYAGSAFEWGLTGKGGASIILGIASGANDPTHIRARDATGTTFIANGAIVTFSITYEAA